MPRPCGGVFWLSWSARGVAKVGGKYTVSHDLENAGHKKDCTCVIFDNTKESSGYEDSVLFEKILEDHHATRASIYILGKDGALKKVRNPRK